MKKKFTLLFIGFSFFSKAQSIVQTVNSGSIISAVTSVSVGEIIITPSSNTQSNSGIIGILAQINQQTLEVNEFEVSKEITVFPNPTTSKIYFNTTNIVINEKVMIYNTSGKLVIQTRINSDKSLDLSSLPSGIYMINFSNKNLKSFKIIKH